MSNKKWKNKSGTPTYNSWKSMRQRVLFRESKYYSLKGITICKRWNSYDLFVEDMGIRPKGTTLDRINNNKGYSKRNCKWSTWNEQENNKEGLTKITYKGQTKTIGEWLTLLKLSKSESGKAYKRHTAYNAKTFEELFSKHLRTHRINQRINKCTTCLTEKTCKWRKNGTECNTCYHRERRKLIK